MRTICAYVDPHGALYCVDCLHQHGRLEEAQDGRQRWARVYSDGGIYREEPCVGCGALVGEGDA
jgi:hypothetical protein